MTDDELSVAPYSRIANEYYDAQLHKTSRNFDEAGRCHLEGWRTLVATDGLVLDVGAGRGRVGEYLGIHASRIVQLDNSQAMLDLVHREQSLLRVLHNAEHLPFGGEQFVAVGAFLCDPFVGLN